MAESIIDIPADVLAYNTYNYYQMTLSTSSIDNKTWTRVSTISLTEGIWLMHLTMRFSTSSEGVRGVICTTNYSNGSFSGFTSQPPMSSGVLYIASPNGYSVVEKTIIAKVDANSSPTTYHVGVYQSSGGSLGMQTCFCRLVQLA